MAHRQDPSACHCGSGVVSRLLFLYNAHLHVFLNSAHPIIFPRVTILGNNVITMLYQWKQYETQ